MNKKDYIGTQGSKPCYIGGQAVIEGVMMRGKSMYSMAVIGEGGKIVVEDTALASASQKPSFLKLPIVRGVVSFVDSLVLGMKIISRSAELAGIETTDEESSKFEKFLVEKFGDKLNDIMMMFSAVIAVIFSIGLFMVLPVAVGGLFSKLSFVNQNTWILGIIEGVLRLIIFIFYIYLISLNKDIQRVFQFHGAEHKTINCLEHEEELTVENIKKYSRLHRRCGTSFLLIVMIISMVFFLFVRTDNFVLRLFSRILFVPLIAGVSYEVIRLAGKSKSKFMDIISYPGMCLQELTTREPDEEHIECAILAMQSVLEKDNKDE